MAQVPCPPVAIFFYCQVAPREGGETPILISHRVLDRITAAFPDFAEKLETRGVRYCRRMPAEDDGAMCRGGEAGGARLAGRGGASDGATGRGVLARLAAAGRADCTARRARLVAVVVGGVGARCGAVRCVALRCVA